MTATRSLNGSIDAALDCLHDGSELIHVVPLNDLVEHDTQSECVCGPRVEVAKRDDGSVGWLYVHHSLDGRELREEE